MPIRPYLGDRAFDPETVAEMGDALQCACDAMQLRNIDDMTTEVVAQKIIQLVQRGVVGVDTLSAMAVKELTSK